MSGGDIGGDIAIAADRAAFILSHTAVGSTALVPEISLRTGDGIEALWQAAQDRFASSGVEIGPPFWAFPWAGGQAIARYLLDHPDVVRGRSVVDLATGSGLCAIAAAMCGAASIVALDIDPFCESAIAANVALQRAPGCDLAVIIGDAFAVAAPRADVVLAGDVWYDRALAARALPWLRAAHERGATVLVGDPGRDFLPPDGWTVLQRYSVPTPRALEGRDAVPAAVATFDDGRPLPPGQSQALLDRELACPRATPSG